MIDNKVVYCLQCGSVKPRETAEIIFKTGFYKIHIPLAHCKDCAHVKESENELDIINEECSQQDIASCTHAWQSV